MSEQHEPAFPNTGNPTWGMEPNYGMTLRDWFAGKIANGMAAHTGTTGLGFGPGDIATRSYEVADAMLAARAGEMRSALVAALEEIAAHPHAGLANNGYASCRDIARQALSAAPFNGGIA
jgi:hypothetical protein